MEIKQDYASLFEQPGMTCAFDYATPLYWDMRLDSVPKKIDMCCDASVMQLVGSFFSVFAIILPGSSCTS